MSGAGEVLENPVSGQRLIVRRTARETGGRFLQVEAVYSGPTPHRPPEHYHPHQEERFEVLAGRLGVRVEGEELELQGGDVLIVPPGTPHTMWSETGGTRIDWRTYPALETESFFRTIWGLAAGGKTDPKGVPGLLQVAVIARRYRDEYRLARPPRPVQDALFGPLALVGRLLGYRDTLPGDAGRGSRGGSDYR